MSLHFIGASPMALNYCKEHRHPFWEIVLNLEGEGIETINGKEYPFEAGTVHFIPPNVPHIKESERGFKDIFIQLDSVAVRGMPDALHTPLVFEDDKDGSVAALMKLMLCRYLRNNKSDSALDLMCELVLQLITERGGAARPDHAVDEICRYLALNFNDPEISIAAVLEQSGYQRDHIRRRFIEACGTTPLQYLTGLRIEYAKDLLRRRRELGLSVADVGVMSGYYDGNYFSRIFKKRVGVAPETFAQSQEDL